MGVVINGLRIAKDAWKGEPMSDLIERADALRLLKEDWDASASRGDDERAEVCKFHYIEISNIHTAESTGALDDAIQEYINKGYMLPAEPKEYVKDGTLAVQIPTIKEAKAINKIVVYADTYKQEYYMPLTKVGKWKLEFLTSTNGDPYAVYRCNLCEWAEPTLLRRNYCPNCGSRMFERRTDETDE